MKKNSVKLTACLLASVVTLSTVSFDATATVTAGVTSYTSNIVTSFTLPTAGATQALAEVMNESDTATQAAVADNGAETVAAKYSTMAVAKVNDYVNIRKKADGDSKLVGKLYNKSVATVIGESGDWYKIKSGSVKGYVKKEFVVVGDEKLIEKVGKKVATVNTETLKVRKKASKDASVVTLVAEGDDLKVKADEKDGWVKVKTPEGKGYVSAEFVDVTTKYTYAESRAEEKARLKREAAAKAAREAAKQPSNGNKKGNRGNGGNGGNGGGSGYKKPSGSTGQAVANYAVQFVGNPYVYGGTSLTHGADCSGFVMSVYKAFGVSLPHSSSAQRSCGYAVKRSNIQPGDIVCYSGHVAIYIGGGRIVHASNRRDGIKISSNVNYRHVVAIRRIF